MSDLACPKCFGRLRFGTAPRGPVGTCYDCWGLWIDTHRLNELRRQYPVGSALHDAAAKLTPRDSDKTTLFCPSCENEPLVRQVVREVELEWCAACRGIYLDKGERERLIGISETVRSHRTLPESSAALGSNMPNSWSPLAVGDVLWLLAIIIEGLFD